jgi:hypothetical protein
MAMAMAMPSSSSSSSSSSLAASIAKRKWWAISVWPSPALCPPHFFLPFLLYTTTTTHHNKSLCLFVCFFVWLYCLHHTPCTPSIHHSNAHRFDPIAPPISAFLRSHPICAPCPCLIRHVATIGSLGLPNG